jgi:hypothetical protein
MIRAGGLYVGTLWGSSGAWIESTLTSETARSRHQRRHHAQGRTCTRPLVALSGVLIIRGPSLPLSQAGCLTHSFIYELLIMSTSFNSNKSTGLPNIPSFPPIEIPNTSNLRSSVDHLPPLDEDSHLSPTTFTSLSPPSHHRPLKSSDGSPQPSPTSPSSLSPSLRKAFSVDSFSRPSRSSPVSVSSRQRGVTSAALASPDEQRRSQVSSWQFQALQSPQLSYVPRDPTSLFPGVAVVLALALRVMKIVHQSRKSQMTMSCGISPALLLGRRELKSGASYAPHYLLESFRYHQNCMARITLPRLSPTTATTMPHGFLPLRWRIFYFESPK